MIAPPHLVPKWAREAALALPYAKAVVVKTIADVDRAMRMSGPVVLVMAETSAKLGADWQETSWYLPHLRQHRCPGCGRPVEAPRAGDKKRPVKCPACAAPLWTQQRLKSGRAKWPLARWLRQRYRGRYDLILDEVHLYKAESQRGFAAYNAIVGAQKVFALTGTPYGGKASTVFYLYFRLFSDFRDAFGWDDLGAFREQYGSVEEKERLDEEYGSSWAYRSRKRRNQKEAPGVSPGIIAWALPHSAFLSLEEVAPDLRARTGGPALPPYTEHVHTVRMDGDMAARYARLRAMRDAGVAELFHGSASLFSTWMMAALGWPDNPTTDVVHRDPKTGAETRWLEGMDVDAGAKERAIVDLAAAEVAAGRKVAIYVGQPDVRDPAAFLTPLLAARGLSVATLTTAVAPEEREEWLSDNRADVLVVNPRLVEVGIDLLDYPVIVYDGIPTYSVYTLMQASRRAWRIGQEKPVDVHFFAYSGTLQATALDLMAKKAAAATAYNGAALEALASLGEDVGDLLAALRERVVAAARSGEDLDAALDLEAEAAPADAAALAGAVRDGALRCAHVNPLCAGDVPVGRALLPADIAAMTVVGVENGVAVLEHTRADAIWELCDAQGRLVAVVRPRAGVAAQTAPPSAAPKPRLAFGDRSVVWQEQRRSNGTRRKVREQANAPAQMRRRMALRRRSSRCSPEAQEGSRKAALFALRHTPHSG